MSSQWEDPGRGRSAHRMLWLELDDQLSLECLRNPLKQRECRNGSTGLHRDAIADAHACISRGSAAIQA
jgi:hypothetical protein